MRVFYRLALLMAATIVSGCVSNTLNGLSNLSTNCTVGATSVSCIAPTGTSGTGTGTGSTGTTGTTTTNTNSGNTTTTTTGDTTLALEANKAISTQANPAVSNLLSNPLLGSTATNKFNINTKTASNSSWPVTKTMDYYLAGGTTSTLADTPNYAEYRYFKPNFDEELQVWSWTNSFTTQYRDVTNSGTAPLHQAWSFGGNYTSVANMPTLNANVNYNGSWTATAQTSNWVNDTTNPAQTVDFNNNWQVRGTSALVANFGTSAFTGTLQSTSWVGKSIAGSSWITVNALVPSANRLDPVMTADVKLTGQITTSTAAGAHPNQINGTANMDNTTYGWITTAGSNPMYGGFFSPVGIPPGSNPTEVAGVFALDTAIPAPVGGNYAINDDRRGFLSMSGMFHGTNP